MNEKQLQDIVVRSSLGRPRTAGMRVDEIVARVKLKELRTNKTKENEKQIEKTK